MAIKETDWLLTSDVADEAAFRVDVPEPEWGRWVLSYLPTSMRVSKEQAIAGLVLAEMILIGLLRAGGEFDGEMAALHADALGLTVTDVMCLLALREQGRGADEGDAGGSWRRPEGRFASATVTRRQRPRVGEGRR
ncbi:hypothetical protein [Nocardia huaxiensis]|uniref:Uncharacterized protein n=1 Tax=Nocardia huaxiensis TaxID=2755382 RepID=A0A7D6ZCK2_9NOCA|nr:hypothetical protein [Nocardia huaxiensis]QLY32208.1 hypothetical protein H0264_08020 [Nocardia huaxiensis]UFS94089.1 hypothetical protein LPY97_25375 [Nocardia huaxiensis]